MKTLILVMVFGLSSISIADTCRFCANSQSRIESLRLQFLSMSELEQADIRTIYDQFMYRVQFVDLELSRLTERQMREKVTSFDQQGVFSNAEGSSHLTKFNSSFRAGDTFTAEVVSSTEVELFGKLNDILNRIREKQLKILPAGAQVRFTFTTDSGFLLRSDIAGFFNRGPALPAMAVTKFDEIRSVADQAKRIGLYLNQEIASLEPGEQSAFLRDLSWLQNSRLEIRDLKIRAYQKAGDGFLLARNSAAAGAFLAKGFVVDEVSCTRCAYQVVSLEPVGLIGLEWDSKAQVIPLW